MESLFAQTNSIEEGIFSIRDLLFIRACDDVEIFELMYDGKVTTDAHAHVRSGIRRVSRNQLAASRLGKRQCQDFIFGQKGNGFDDDHYMHR
jgi:hypothetical protein